MLRSQIWIRWLKYLSFIFYGYNLLLKIEFGDREYSCDDFYRKFPDAPPVSLRQRSPCLGVKWAFDLMGDLCSLGCSL